MDTAMLIVTILAMVISAIAAAAAVVQARAARASQVASEDARNESRQARDEAVRLSTEANAAFVRQAEAQEEGNRLARAALPERAPTIEVQHVRGSRWRATNAGNVRATAAQVIPLSGIVRPEDDAPRSLDVGDSLFFVYTKTLSGEDPRIRIELEWLDAVGEVMKAVSDVTLP